MIGYVDWLFVSWTGNPWSAKNESKTIFVVRNPFDVVISFHKWMTLFENNKNHPWYSGNRILYYFCSWLINYSHIIWSILRFWRYVRTVFEWRYWLWTILRPYKTVSVISILVVSGKTFPNKLQFYRALEFQKLNPEKYKVLFFENAKADLGFVLSTILYESYSMSKSIWLILYGAYSTSMNRLGLEENVMKQSKLKKWANSLELI